MSNAERLQLADQERAVIELHIGIFRVKFPDSLSDGEPRERLCKIDFPFLIRYVAPPKTFIAVSRSRLSVKSIK